MKKIKLSVVFIIVLIALIVIVLRNNKDRDPSSVQESNANTSRVYQTNGYNLQLHDLETVPDHEMPSIQKISDTMLSFFKNHYEKKENRFDPATGLSFAGTRRGVHPKAHGCVMGKFKISRNIPKYDAIGIFQPESEYDAFVRFSNGSPRSNVNDSGADTRGIGIKLLNANNNPLLGKDFPEKSQDFTLNSSDSFFADNAGNYSNFLQIALLETSTFKAGVIKYILGLVAFGEVPLSYRIFKTFQKIQSVVATNPLAIQYWSITAFQHGKEPTSPTVKYSVVPCDGTWIEPVDKTEPNFLRKNLQNHLNQKSACFRFLLQHRADSSLSIEDPTQPWEESKAPFYEIAKLIIPKQNLYDDRKCESEVINPWNSLPEHKPIGGINRIRLASYLLSINKRKETNRY